MRLSNCKIPAIELRKEIEQIAYSLIEYQPGMIHFIKGNHTYLDFLETHLDFLETHDLYNSQEYRLPTTKGFKRQTKQHRF